jgi:hypothetical protein
MDGFGISGGYPTLYLGSGLDDSAAPAGRDSMGQGSLSNIHINEDVGCQRLILDLVATAVCTMDAAFYDLHRYKAGSGVFQELG